MGKGRKKIFTGSPNRGAKRPSALRRAFFAVLILAIAAGSSAIGLFAARHYRELSTATVVKNTVAAVTPIVTPAPQPPAPSSSATLLIGGSVPVPIIMYHDVVPRKQVWFDLTTDEFAQQMHDLAAADAHPVSMQAVFDHLNEGKPLPDHPILLTFDDCTLGQFTEVLPILKARKFPAVFFVQTASVGVKTEKEHMTWEQLKQAESTGLIEVESHTVTHPEDITKLSDSELVTELQDSKQAIESHLNHPIRFLAYPSGHCDARIAKATQDAGYLAAVTMDRGFAASPAQSYFLPRFTPKRVEEVIATWRGDNPVEPLLPRLITITNSPLTQGTFTEGSHPVTWVAGGDLGSQSLQGRRTVGEMAWDAKVQAALNGTFFADARVESNGSGMIGPTLCRTENNYSPSEPSEDVRLEGRPLVLVGNEKCLVLPYTEHLGHSREVLESLLPDIKDAFLAGGWIVHNGKAVAPDLIKAWSTGDANDARHRAFAGIDSDHRYLLGAVQDSISTTDLSRILEQMHVEEAWLMDSGFSTSLIWRNRVLVSGHAHKDRPSRPVPHCLFLFGDPATDAPEPPADAPIAGGPGAATTAEALAADGGGGGVRVATHRHRRRRRRRTVSHSTESPTAASPGTAAPAATGVPPF